MQIDFQSRLNPAQLEAVTSTQGPLLVIAGAGSGKTRTIIYRLAYLVHQGADPSRILLLTFTRKAAQQMLTRAGRLLGRELQGVVTGGTFHSFAHGVLRRHGALLGLQNSFTILDKADAESVIKQVRDLEGIAPKDRLFPRKNTIQALLSKSRNKELSLQEILERDSPHLLHYAPDLENIFQSYQAFKQEHSLLDYDDLLFRLEELLLSHPDLKQNLSAEYTHIMVDEFQDTNLVQGRLVQLLSGREQNLMAVGDDAQSIYSFRGATVSNILQFEQAFPEARLVKLEQNYRSTQPILSLSNQILAQAREKFEKNLFSQRKEGSSPEILRSISDQSQARVVLQRIRQLLDDYSPLDIAILFRASFQSYPLEVLLNREGLEYQKFGGIRFSDAAHVKDVLAFFKLVQNPADLPAWQRCMALVPQVGAKRCMQLYTSLFQEDRSYLDRACKKNQELDRVIKLLQDLRSKQPSPYQALELVMDYYQPKLKELYPDDYPKRQAGLDQLAQICSVYVDLEQFLADMSLEAPEQQENSPSAQEQLTLSTVHSAKGLEWPAVFILDLVEDRFPSRHAALDEQALEEERRLFYVACTRAKDYLGLCVPQSLHNRFKGSSEPVTSSPFVRELQPGSFQEYQEQYSGALKSTEPKAGQGAKEPEVQTVTKMQDLGFCRHRIFGRGKVVKFVPPNKYQVNFPGFGLKMVIQDYIQLEG
ncbi:MAG: ATP-dependent helicase [Desulfohalobiaceae bacterium]